MTGGRSTGRSGLASSVPRDSQAVGGPSDCKENLGIDIWILLGLPQVIRSW